MSINPARIGSNHPYVRHCAARAKAFRKEAKPHAIRHVSILNRGRSSLLSDKQIDILIEKGFCEVKFLNNKALFCLTMLNQRGVDYFRITVIDPINKRFVGIRDFKVGWNGVAESEIKLDDIHMKLPGAVIQELDKRGFGSSEIASIYNDVAGEEAAFYIVVGYRQKDGSKFDGLSKTMLHAAMSIGKRYGATEYFLKKVGGMFGPGVEKLQAYYVRTFGAEMVAGQWGTVRIDLTKPFLFNTLPAPVASIVPESSKLLPAECYY